MSRFSTFLQLHLLFILLCLIIIFFIALILKSAYKTASVVLSFCSFFAHLTRFCTVRHPEIVFFRFSKKIIPVICALGFQFYAQFYVFYPIRRRFYLLSLFSPVNRLFQFIRLNLALMLPGYCFFFVKRPTALLSYLRHLRFVDPDNRKRAYLPA